MAPVKITEDGEILVKCPMCSGYRPYSNIRQARYAATKEKVCVACARVRRKEFAFKKGISSVEISRIARNAAARGFLWGISDEDIHHVWQRQKGKCALTGVAMCKHPRTWSIDRIDNTCGYVPSNIQLVTKDINMMRGSLTVEEFVSYCRQVAANRSEE